MTHLELCEELQAPADTPPGPLVAAWERRRSDLLAAAAEEGNAKPVKLRLQKELSRLDEGAAIAGQLRVAANIARYLADLEAEWAKPVPRRSVVRLCLAQARPLLAALGDGELRFNWEKRLAEEEERLLSDGPGQAAGLAYRASPLAGEETSAGVAVSADERRNGSAIELPIGAARLTKTARFSSSKSCSSSMDDLETPRGPKDVSEAATVFMPAPPVAFDRYVLLRELGRGGAGFVWLAQDRVLGAPVALKTLREEMTSQPSALQELKREVLLNRTLSHPNIIKTFDFVTHGRASAIAMEYVNGTNLQRLKAERKEGFFEAEDIAKWVAQLCAAMEYAHRQRVVHRDLKPANLMIDAAGDLKVGDFGIGRTMAETAVGLTRNSSGTPPFMSPQQTMGEAAVPSDDIYSIGATVYDLLTGDPPFFRGAIREQALAKVAPPMSERRKELGRKGREIPREWEAAVAAALAKEAAGRPASAADLGAAFAGCPVLLEMARSVPRQRRQWKGLGWAAAAAVALAAALAIFRPWNRPGIHATAMTAANVPAPSGAAAPVEGAALRDMAVKGTAAPGSTLAAAPAVAASTPEVPRNPVDEWVDAGKITRDEGGLLKRSLAGLQGEFELRLAQRLVLQHALSPAEWRDYTGLVAPPDPVVGQLRPLFAAGMIREKEFAWLAAALGGAKGDAELALARRFVEAREITPAQWRAQTSLYPPPPVDPIVEKVKPLFTTGLISAAERSWLEAALADKKGAAEKQGAESLVEAKTLTAPQWRVHTALGYPAIAAALGDPARWPPALDLALNATVTIRLLRVDPGSFLRGTPLQERGRRNNEPVPEQAAIAQPFYLGIYEVTQAEYTAVMPRNPSYWRGHPQWPIDQVDWQSLTGPNGFLDRLNRNLSRQFGGAIRADLPTNDEWEYACRAGTQSSFYQGGAISDLQRDPILDTLANYNRVSGGSPQPVGSYAPNAWGFYDMLGNVAEWCRARYVRGGSWQSNAAGCRIGWRTQLNSDSDTDPSPNVGFRLALRKG